MNWNLRDSKSWEFVLLEDTLHLSAEDSQDFEEKRNAQQGMHKQQCYLL